MSYTKNTALISTLIISAVALGNAGSTLYLPALPIITNDLHTTAAMMRLSLSLFLIGFGLSQLIYGPLSDIFGRRIILIIGLFIFLIGTIIATESINVSFLLTGRLIEGVGIGAANAVGYALMRDIYNGDKLTIQLSYISVFVGMTPLVAPLLGGYLVTYINWQACFVTLAIIDILILVGVFVLLPETLLTKAVASPKQIIINYWFLLKHGKYSGFVLCVSLSFAALLTMGSMLPFLIVNKLGISPSLYGWIAGIPALGYVSGAFIGGKLSKNLGILKLIYVSVVLNITILILALLLNWHSFDIISLLTPLLFFMFGIGLIIPTGSSGAMSPFPELAGSAAALLGTLMFSIASIFTAIGSHLKAETPIPLFSLLLTILILTYGALLIAKKGVQND